MNSLEEKSNAFISGFMLANFLQLINLEQKTCTLKVNSKNKVGYLHLIKGELVNAETSDLDGEKAATRIISWKNVSTEVQDIRQTERKVHTPLMHILLNSTCHADENGEALDYADLMEEAVNLAEGHHLKKAKLLITRILKHDKRNHKAWLWFLNLRYDSAPAASTAPHSIPHWFCVIMSAPAKGSAATSSVFFGKPNSRFN